ncbi:MAG: N-acetylmuramoyl-L-alanine amidase [Roseofilum sp. SID2]|uniref:N-acetylmuramoyl-L-alanine amidase n=1 Tax=Roseofilum sp. SID3 TaxID=2821499 RepID=UPI001B1BB6C7|nr:N-acetylmuramoyl-L-alanine amidase [Roseofilum sp. SID3]MBP0015488.1 N-acetylmuramoyl-L-alanine amidase [Roseofilum sp. SID3]MBP0023194.1 N-acetylmuramoyl-L-alanine amidase [Roseofilum sp. SID2]
MKFSHSKGPSVKLRWLFPSLLGLWLWSAPVQAASLQYWRFDARNNRLEFATNGRVQPTAQLIFNPTRLVIDLPGTTLGNQIRSQFVSTPGIKQVRTGQFERNTTRIVIELTPGYTLDPSQVRFVGSSASQWTVQLPQLQREGTTPTRSNPPPTLTSPPNPRPVAQQPSPNRSTNQIEVVRVTGDGFFIRTTNQPDIARVERSSDQRQIEIDLKGVALPNNLNPRRLNINSRGVNQLILSPLEGDDAGTRITLNVNPQSADWQALPNRLGMVLIPRAGSGTNTSGSRPWPAGRQITAADSNQSDPTQPPLIQAIELSGGNSQLVVRATGRVNAVGQWPNPSVYTLRVSPARLGENVPSIPVGGNSPFSRFDVQQADEQTVVISMTPRSGFTLGQINQAGSQVIALSLGSSGSTLPPIATSPNPRPSTVPIPVPRPANPQPAPSRPSPGVQWPLPSTRRTPNSRITIVIDPGHGGRDPGAVGIGGLRETDVVLDISRQVAAILQQNGIQVILTRDREVEIDLAPRVNLAQRVNATLFVSIHANAISLSRPDVNGVETYYYNTGLRLAQAIQGSILRSIPMRDRGVKRARFYVLRRTSMPSVLVETGFVTGAQDAPRLRTPAFRSQMAQAIANGILLYVRQNY